MNCAIFGVQCNVGTSPGWGALGCPAANIVQPGDNDDKDDNYDYNGDSGDNIVQPGDNGVKDDNYNDKGDNIVQSGIVWLITQYLIIVPKNIQ